MADDPSSTDAEGTAGASTGEEPPVAAPSRSTWQRFRVPVASAMGVIVVAVVLLLASRATGLLVAGAVAFLWAATRVEYAVAVGGVGAAVLVAPGQPYPAVVAASVLAVFVADLLLRWRRRTTAVALLVLLAAAGAFSETARIEPTWVGALAAVGGFAAVAYTVHRYELVVLGLVEGGEA